jgi:hypothetical protein
VCCWGGGLWGLGKGRLAQLHRRIVTEAGFRESRSSVNMLWIVALDAMPDHMPGNRFITLNTTPSTAFCSNVPKFATCLLWQHSLAAF